MGVLADLVPKAQSALIGAGCSGEATEGATWRFKFDEIVDNNDDPIDLSGVTGSAVVLTAVGGTVVATLDFTGAADGSCVLELDEADTAGLAAGETRARRCAWAFTLDDGTDVVQVWGASNSPFHIFPGAA